MVSGTITGQPAGSHLWIFARRSGLGIWWPQGGDETIPGSDGRWKVLAHFGTADDAGSQFEITAAVVDDSANARLQKWFDDAAQTGNYPGIRLPNTLCTPIQWVTVNRP
jgi:hypothetical protein